MLKRIFVYPYGLWLFIFIVAPLLIIVWFSFGGTDFTLYHYARFFSPLYEGQPFFQRIYIAVLMRSIYLAVISTVICFVLGYPLAYALAKFYSHKSFLLFLFLVPLWMNFLLRTYAWLTILEQNGVLNAFLGVFGLPATDLLFTDMAVVIGMVYNFLPFMVLPIYTVLRDMDKSIVEAAQDLGANKVQVFLKIVFPLSVPGVISGVTMVFMPGVTTFVISNLLGGGQFILVGNLIEQQFLRVGDWYFGSAMAVILMVLILFMMGLIKLFDRQPKDGRTDKTAEGGALY
ncbi:MAG: ABC transporter permease [Defluviitaleaceae bacterium]|nr:ABC transporter permease [Defluviitaleaceae bacterium]